MSERKCFVHYLEPRCVGSIRPPPVIYEVRRAGHGRRMAGKVALLLPQLYGGSKVCAERECRSQRIDRLGTIGGRDADFVVN